MAHQTYNEAKRMVYGGLVLLAVVTVIEVIFSLFGKGHLGWKEAYYLDWVHYSVGALIAVLSFYKAYYIVKYFMHLGMETRTLSLTILIPLVLLVFAVYAFLVEGNHWNNNRSYIINKNELQSERVVPDLQQNDAGTYRLEQ